jgi:hypothetical protein
MCNIAALSMMMVAACYGRDDGESSRFMMIPPVNGEHSDPQTCSRFSFLLTFACS